MEDALVSKMRELMAVLDQVKKYRLLLSGIQDFVIIFALAGILALSVDIGSKLSVVFISYGIIPSTVAAINLVILIMGTTIGLFWVKRKLRTITPNQWSQTLDEGAPGAIKLLQELDWEKVYSEIRYSKLGIWLEAITKTVAYWLVTAFIFLFATSILYMGFDFIMIDLFSLALVLILSKNDLQKRYDKVGRLDSLMWELRWFDNEFRRHDFEA